MNLSESRHKKRREDMIKFIFDLLLLQSPLNVVAICFDNREKGYPKNWILKPLEGRKP